MYVNHDEPYVLVMVAHISAPATRNGSPAPAFLLSRAADHFSFTPDRRLLGRLCFQKKEQQ
jgi:hypothetical protein